MASDQRDSLRKRLQEDDQLYERFAKSLEKDHGGEFVAISRDGRVIISISDIEVLQKALQEFGSGNFAFRRIGQKAIGKWRRPL